MNEDIIEEYLGQYGQGKGESVHTQDGARIVLKKFLEAYGDKDLMEINKVDVIRYLNFLEKYKYTPKSKKGAPPKPSKPYTKSTQFMHKSHVRQFLKWFHENEDYQVPNLAPMIRLKRLKREELPSGLISYQEAQRMIDACENNQRDRAMIAFLIEGGVRRGELLDIKYKHVTFEKGGVAVIVPRGKTVTRRVFCGWCTQELFHWKEMHSTKRPDDYLFCSLRPPHGKFSKTGLFNAIKKISAKAGMDRNIFTHLFRHSSATYHAGKGLGDQELDARYGWAPGSMTVRMYMHLSGTESDGKIQKINDLPITETEVAGEKMLVCPTCRLSNRKNAARCRTCNTALSEAEIAKDRAIEDAKEKAKMQELKRQIKQEIEAEIQNTVANAMEKVRTGHVKINMPPKEDGRTIDMEAYIKMLEDRKINVRGYSDSSRNYGSPNKRIAESKDEHLKQTKRSTNKDG